ncbi:RimJ/RimL family protein N-acetyltransferase [Streptomyces spectabilis]|uniref:RimJ/RimL family protein N-acetyltransferase n=2 Tax=Streptomyces spectabilis TaxID=68270 RepID=A0A7W8F011_STRST|nr:GNAT family protein [Streptomyces spectabilis]MBB5109739.1 RimJ/RimL family protein N-acetyltransferase [Streptomyces spectabilis]
MPEVLRASERLAVRELVPDDGPGVLAIYGDPKATEHLSFDPRTHDQVEAMVTRSIAAAAADPRTEYVLAVVEHDQGQLVGIGRLAADPHQPRAATTGFALRSDRWGKGYGVEMVRLLLGFAFDDLGLHRVWGARSPLNTASAKTMATVGMVEEGTIREHVQRGGVWRDSVVHAILDREWQQPTD